MPEQHSHGSISAMDQEITYNRRLIEGLLKHGRECEWIEFKQNNSDPQVIGEAISALSNSAFIHDETSVSYTHLTLPTTPYV